MNKYLHANIVSVKYLLFFEHPHINFVIIFIYTHTL